MILWWILSFSWFVWIIAWAIICKYNPEQAEDFSKNIWLFFLHIKVFFRWLFNFNWITKKIDSKNSELNWDFAKKYPVVIQYKPPDWINCAEAWLLLYRRVRAKDLLSLIYKWKADGLIDINIENKSKITITKIHMMPSSYKNYEEHLFDVLIPYPITILEKYLKRNPKFDKKLLENYAIKKWWIIPSKSRIIINKIIISIFFIYLICLVVVSIITKSTYIIWYGFLWLILLIFFLMLTKSILMTWNAYTETEEWAKLISHILGYKKFLETCDKNKLILSLKDNPSHFEKTLSYATVLWIKNDLINKISPAIKNTDTAIYKFEDMEYSNNNGKYCLLIWVFIMLLWFIIFIFNIIIMIK